MHSRFRPSPSPRLPLPFGIRSCGQYILQGPRVIDRTGARAIVQLYWGISGLATFGFPTGEVELRAGEVLIYPLGSHHLVTASEQGCEYRWVTFDGPLADSIVTQFGLVPPWPRRAGPAPVALFEELDRLLHDPGMIAERQAATVGWALLSAAASTVSGNDPLVTQVQEMLVASLADPDLAIENIALRFAIDRSVLTRRFTISAGMSPKQYLQSVRLNRAMTLLSASDETVQVIATACGFSTGNYFARVFKSATGETPEKFRQHVR